MAGIGLRAAIGLSVFEVSSIARMVPVAATYRGVLPFIFTDLVRLFPAAALPGLAPGSVRLLG